MARRRARRPRPGADRDRAPAAGVGRAGPGRVVDVGGRRVRERARARAVGLRDGRRDRFLRAHARPSPSSTPTCARSPPGSSGRTGGPTTTPLRSVTPPRSAPRPEWCSTARAMRRSWRGWRGPRPDALDSGALGPAAARLRRRPHDRRGRDRRDARVAHGPERARWRVARPCGSRPTASACRRSSSPDAVVGRLSSEAARALGLRPEVRVIAGAGDRACEVLGSGASARAPMVSWGTTANVSVPHPGPVAALPAVAAVSRGALGRFRGGSRPVGGRRGGGVARVASPGAPTTSCSRRRPRARPGAGGVLVLPWFAGARAPWWRADAHAAFIGLTDAHGPGELARGVVEGIALDVARCLELIAPERPRSRSPAPAPATTCGAACSPPSPGCRWCGAPSTTPRRSARE